MNLPLILLGKMVSKFSFLLNLGSGGTWPGELALNFSPSTLSDFLSKVKKGIIIVGGTNGKTTTAKMIQSILQNAKSEMSTNIVHNDSGANLLNGIVSAFIQKASWNGAVDVDWAILEVDENALPLLISNLKSQKVIIVLLNLFRDQLDRYGELDSIATKWDKALQILDKDALLILNADDPQIAYLGKNKKAKIIYFGLNKPEKFLKLKEHATDSTYCRNCGSKLEYTGIYFSHLGIWYCPKCGNKRPKPDISNWNSNLPGLYNEYNTLAGVSVGKELNIDKTKIENAIKEFTPVFGRQEEIDVDGKKVKIFLSKNPAGFNASLRTVLELGAKHLLFLLNDRIPDGTDISWIWDVDFEMLPAYITPVVSGDRAYDMALRLKYARAVYKLPPGAVSEPPTPILIYEELPEALKFSLEGVEKGETLYVLATYSAMLETRKILKGRKIL